MTDRMMTGFINWLPWLLVGLVALISVAPKACSQALGALWHGIGQLFHVPGEALDRLATGCRELLEKTLAWEEEQLGLNRIWPGLMVITRLFYGALAADVIASTVYLDIESMAPVLFGANAPPVQLPLDVNIGVVTGLLTFACISLIGMLLLEVLGGVPASVALYPNPKPAFRRILGWTAGIGSLLTLAMVVLVFVDRELITQGKDWPLAAILVSSFQGALANICAVIAFWAVVLGLLAVISVAFASPGCSCGRSICRLMWANRSATGWLSS